MKRTNRRELFEKYTVEVGKRIRACRHAKRLSVYEVGDKAQLCHAQVVNIELGKVNVPIGTYLRLARALGVPVREWLAVEDRGEGRVDPRSRLRRFKTPLRDREVMDLRAQRRRGPLPRLLLKGETLPLPDNLPAQLGLSLPELREEVLSRAAKEVAAELLSRAS